MKIQVFHILFTYTNDVGVSFSVGESDTEKAPMKIGAFSFV
jgi:hypothetical protein